MADNLGKTPKERGQSGRRPVKIWDDDYPLDKRYDELQSEQHYPIDPRWKDKGKRVPTIDLVDENSGRGKEAQGRKMTPSPQSETWDSPQALSEENVRMKFVKVDEFDSPEM